MSRKAPNSYRPDRAVALRGGCRERRPQGHCAVATRPPVKNRGPEKLRNIGPKSSAVLQSAGIGGRSQLIKLGSVRAFARVRAVDPSVTLNLLWALEGAILDEPWQVVARKHKTSLLLALEDHERQIDQR